MIVVLAGILLTMLLVMAAAWWTQRVTANAGWGDVFWTFGTGLCGVVASLVPFSSLTLRQGLVAVCVGLWSLRLGTYIAWRVARSRTEDPRYASFRREWGVSYERRILGFLLIQAPITTALCLAILIAAHGRGSLLPTDGIAVLLLLCSIGGEALADHQMHRFRAGGTGKVCRAGLWGLSRHPNYFFEWVVWLAYPVAAFGAYGWRSVMPWLTLLAPLLMYWLLTRVSGVPPLEKAMLASRGEAYRAYQSEVSAFFPRPRRRS